MNGKLVVKKVVLKGKMTEAPAAEERLQVRSGATAAAVTWASWLQTVNTNPMTGVWAAIGWSF